MTQWTDQPEENSWLCPRFNSAEAEILLRLGLLWGLGVLLLFNWVYDRSRNTDNGKREQVNGRLTDELTNEFHVEDLATSRRI
jgi:hypothetical protein